MFNSTIHENEDGDDDNEVINENTDANENLEINEFEKIEIILFNNTNNDDENDKTYEEEKSENGKRKSEDDDDVSFVDQTRENNEKTLRPRNINLNYDILDKFGHDGREENFASVSNQNPHPESARNDTHTDKNDTKSKEVQKMTVLLAVSPLFA